MPTSTNRNIEPYDSERLYYTLDAIYQRKIIPLGKNKLYALVYVDGFPKSFLGRKILIPVEPLRQWVRENVNASIPLN